MFQVAETRVLSRSWFPLFRRFLGGTNWMYDICRFSGTRDLRCIFDVGANVGNLTLELTAFFPVAEIHAFEPITTTFVELKRRTRHRSPVHCHQLALADKPGEFEIVLQPCSGLNSLRYLADGSSDPGCRERIRVSTVSDFCAEAGIAELDVLKIDTQGCDLAVLRGAARLLHAAAVPFLFVEASFTKDDATNQDFSPQHEFVTDLGYRACGVYDQLNFGPHLSLLGCFNVLYLHPEAMRQRFPSFPRA
jgi:FkbM family methyltransferase